MSRNSKKPVKRYSDVEWHRLVRAGRKLGEGEATRSSAPQARAPTPRRPRSRTDGVAERAPAPVAVEHEPTDELVDVLAGAAVPWRYRVSKKTIRMLRQSGITTIPELLALGTEKALHECGMPWHCVQKINAAMVVTGRGKLTPSTEAQSSIGEYFKPWRWLRS